MIFNKKDSVQKNWRMVKKGKNIVFGCMLFFAAGAVAVNPLVTVFNGNGIVYAQTGIAPEIVDDLAGKASTVAVVTVKAQAGSTVKLYDANDIVIGEAAADTQGIATINPSNSLPEGKITATSTPVGGDESPKSAPVTVTRATLDEAGGRVARGQYNTQLSVGKTKLTVYPGDSINVPIVATANYMEKFWVPQNPVIISGVIPVGGFLETAKTATVTSRQAEFKGTVAMNQPAGNFTITFAVKGKKRSGAEGGTNTSSTVTVDLNVIVLELAKKYTPVLNKKVTVDNPNNVTRVEKDKIISIVEQNNPTLPNGTTYSVDNKGNVTVTYPDASQDKISSAYSIQKRPVITTDLTDKALTKTPIEATAEPGSTVILYDKNNDKIGEGTADSAGRVTIIPDVNIPEGNVTAKATDTRGNISDSSNPVVATKERVRPVINIPYDDAANQAIYVYSGEENNISLKITDNSGKIVKAYLTFGRDDRIGLGLEDTEYLNGKTQAALYLKANSIHSETVATAANPAVINVTGNIPKGIYQDGAVITRYLFAEDGAGNTSYANVGANTDAGAVGRIRFIWKPQTFKYDAQIPSTPSVVNEVPNATELTKIIKNANPTFSDKIESVALNGNNVVVTYKDGSTDMLNAAAVFTFKVINPAITPVININKLTEFEKDKVKEAIKKVNPAVTNITVSNNGTATITFIGGSIATLESNKTIKTADANGVAEPAAKTPVKNTSALTNEEKDKVKDAVQAANPTATKVEVGEDGTATVTFPDGSTATLSGDKTVKAADANGVAEPAAKTPVKNTSALTNEEKDKVKDAVQAANPTATKVEVGEDGTATVTFPDGSTATLSGDKTVKAASVAPEASGTINIPGNKVPVGNKENLTPEEIAKVKEKVEKVNPGKTVAVDTKGNATVTDPNTNLVLVISAEELVKLKEQPQPAPTPSPIIPSDKFEVKVPTVKVPVADAKNLTLEEVTKVKEEVEKVNPGKTVVVDAQGNATVTDSNDPTATPATIPGDNLVVEKEKPEVLKPATPVVVHVPGNKVPVGNKENLTPEEIAKVKEVVEKVNPGKTVVVDAKGNARLTDQNTGKVVVIPGESLVEQKATPLPTPKQSESIKIPLLTIVENPRNLTSDEKEKVKKAVKAANPTATKVEVGEDGTATVTFPDGSVAILTPTQTILPKEVKPSDKNKNRDGVDDVNYKAIDNKGRLSSTGLNSTESSVLGLIGLFAGIALATRRREKEK